MSALIILYVAHFSIDRALLRPLANTLVSRKLLPSKKADQFRESLWKNIAVGAFFSLGLYIGVGQDWFMNRALYFTTWPEATSSIMRWYYALYASYWLQSWDFLWGLSHMPYQIQRKDSVEMALHHGVTLILMGVSYATDLTQEGLCVLMIHDVNDLILETAKVCVYLEWAVAADVFFGLFALVWYALRWGFLFTNLISAAYTNAYSNIIEPLYASGGYAGYSPDVYYRIYLLMMGLLGALQLLHVFWGILVGKMVLRALTSGKVAKDIRSDDEGDDEVLVEDHEAKKNT